MRIRKRDNWPITISASSDGLMRYNTRAISGRSKANVSCHPAFRAARLSRKGGTGHALAEPPHRQRP